MIVQLSDTYPPEAVECLQLLAASEAIPPDLDPWLTYCEQNNLVDREGPNSSIQVSPVGWLVLGRPECVPAYERLFARLLCLLQQQDQVGNNDALPLPSHFDLERNEQRVAIAVCKATSMTPEQWGRLDYPSREPWLEETIKTLSPAVERSQPPRRAVQDEESLDLRALKVLLVHRDWTKKKIAEHLGCNPKSLTRKRCPQLDAAMRAYKSTSFIRGSKGKDGTVEACDEHAG